MAGRIRNTNWQEDEKLKQDLRAYVAQGLKHEEILDFVKRDYQEYTWSFRTLDRRLRAYRQITVEDVEDAVQKELDGPGQLFGYRAMQNKLRQEHGLNVPRDLVHDVMYELDEEGLAARRPCQKQKCNKGHFTMKGVNWVFSLDGHDKLMGYQNSTFPLAVYGCLDTATRKLMWLKIWVSNSDPNVIAKWYLEYLYEASKMPSILRLDKGTETVNITTMHAFLRQHHGDMDPKNTVIMVLLLQIRYKKCQLFVDFFRYAITLPRIRAHMILITYSLHCLFQIERWWKELHERLEKYFKEVCCLLSNCKCPCYQGSTLHKM